MNLATWSLIGWITTPFILILAAATIENWHNKQSLPRRLWDNVGTGIALTTIMGERLHAKLNKHSHHRQTPSHRHRNRVEHLRLNGNRWEHTSDPGSPE